METNVLLPRSETYQNLPVGWSCREPNHTMTATPLLSPLGLGTGRLASLGSRTTTRNTSFLLNTAIDQGIRVIDTADTYGSGDSERAIGKALGVRARSEFFLITKAGLRHVAMPAAFSPLNQIGKKFVQLGSPRRNFSKQYLLRCIEASLKRLRMEYVDAFLLHAVETGEPTAETWEALDLIRSKGLSRMTGISTGDLAVVREGLAAGQVSIVETPISASARSAREICDLCFSHGVAIVGNEVLKPRAMTPEQADRWNLLRLKYGLADTSTIHLLIAYALTRPAVRCAVVGSTSPEHLVENLNAIHYKDHTALFEELKELFR